LLSEPESDPVRPNAMRMRGFLRKKHGFKAKRLSVQVCTDGFEF